MRPSLARLHPIAACVAALLALTATSAQAYWIRDCKTVPTTWSGSTSMVADLNPGVANATTPVFGFSSQNELMTPFNGSLYFQADDGQHGNELWRVGSGTPALVADVAPGAMGSSPHAFAVWQGRLYFAAATAQGHDALFRSDGSTVTLVAETGASTEPVSISALTTYGGRLYFVRSTGVGNQLWRYDGSTAQPVTVGGAVISDIDDSSLLDRPFVTFKNRLYFVGFHGAEYRLWAYDDASTTLIRTLTPPGNTVSYTFGLGVYGDALYFGTVVPAQSPFQADELWRYAGSGQPTKIGTLDGNAWSGSQSRNFVVYRDMLYFSGGAGLYRYDGSTLDLLDSGPSGLPWHPEEISLYASADRLYFRGFYDSWEDSEPYLFDGMSASLVKDIMPSDGAPYPGSFPSRAVEVGNALYFYASDATHGRELWRMQPTTRVPQLKCDIVVAPIWTDWRLWIVREREVIVATWLLAPGARPQLLSRERVTARPDRELRLHVLDVDARRARAPAGATLLSRVYDAHTGAVLDSGQAPIGAGSSRSMLRGATPAQFREPTLQQVMQERVGGR